MNPPTITVAALGRRSLAWLPTGEEPVVVLAPELEERRRAFVRYIEDELQHDENENDYESLPVDMQASRVGCAIRRHAALLVASDPVLAGVFLGPLHDEDRNLDGRNLSAWLSSRLGQLNNQIGSLLEPWATRNVQNLSRPSSDNKAQSAVRALYGNQCILTGVDRTEGAHIVPARVTANYRLADIWSALCSFFPADRLADLSYRGREPTNIMPLARGAHSRWDAFEFYLRPIPDPDTPSTRLYLQFVWNDDGLAVGTRSSDTVLAEVVNGRRPIDGVSAYPPVFTGDVFLLETADPNTPAAGVHRIVGGLRATKTLASLFRRPSPDEGNDRGVSASGSGPHDTTDDGLALLDEDSELPRLSQVLLQTAVAKNILSPHDAGRWARAFMLDVRLKERGMMRLMGIECDSSTDED